MSTSSTGNGDNGGSSGRTRRHPPSRSVVDPVDGRKWRMCAGCAVLNSSHQLLVGERTGKPESWQTPQGGVDDVDENDGGEREVPETASEAAARELFEEVGLVVGRHVAYENAAAAAKPVRYETTGTGSWLRDAGYAGQELHWTVFRVVDGRLDSDDPGSICRLEGLNGEPAEFDAVRWDDPASVASNVWSAKRGPYDALLEALVPITGAWEERIDALNLTGIWARCATSSTGVADGLVARGIEPSEARRKAMDPYVQSWERATSSSSREWTVTTYGPDGATPRRVLRYPLGSWEEPFEGDSTLFGPEGGIVKRRTIYLAEPDASPVAVAHVTVSKTPRGLEEARRYLRDDKLVLRRTFWSPGEERGSGVVSTEVFLRR